MYIKNIAYNFLIKYRINSLNFNFNLLEEIALSNNWKLCSYSSNKDLIKSLNLEKNIELDAFSFIKKDSIIIFYNDKLQNNDIIFNILHEFGHIFLKHKNISYSLNCPNLVEQENEANLFACEVLAPSCVLKQLNIKSIDDILKFSNLPAKHSIYHINNITNFSNIDEISERLIKIFNDYIKRNTYIKEETKPKKENHIQILSIFGIVSIILIVSFVFLKEKGSSNDIPLNNNTVNNSVNENIDNIIIYYATKTGSKYHLPDCRYIKNKNNLIPLNDNLFKNYEPCSVCIK